EAVVEPVSFGCEAIEVRSLQDLVSITTHGRGDVVVGHYVEDVRPALPPRASAGGKRGPGNGSERLSASQFHSRFIVHVAPAACAAVTIKTSVARIVRPQDFVWLLLFSALAYVSADHYEGIPFLLALAALQVLETKIEYFSTSQGNIVSVL